MTGIIWVSIIALLILSCGDVVKNAYETRAEAMADKLFERGWLPIIIPESAHSITTKNNLDKNSSEGGFSFDLNELDQFTANLQELNANSVSSYQQIRYLERDYQPYEYSEGKSIWTFFINSSLGKVEYEMEFEN